MNFWNVASTMEGELFVSTHLTERGAMKAAIFDIMDFLCVDYGDPRSTYKNVPLCTDPETIKAMTDDELLIEFRMWAEETWDNDSGFNLEIVRSQLAA
jgi:hypothetical protein